MNFANLILKECHSLYEVPMCTGTPHFIVLALLSFSYYICLHIEGLWWSCFKRVYWFLFSNSICSFCVCVTFREFLQYFKLFQYYCICWTPRQETKDFSGQPGRLQEKPLLESPTTATTTRLTDHTTVNPTRPEARSKQRPRQLSVLLTQEESI